MASLMIAFTFPGKYFILYMFMKKTEAASASKARAIKATAVRSEPLLHCAGGAVESNFFTYDSRSLRMITM